MERIIKFLSKMMWKGKHFSKSVCVTGQVSCSIGYVLGLREPSRENDIRGRTGEGRSPWLLARPAFIRLSFRPSILELLGSTVANGQRAAVGEGRLVVGGLGETSFESKVSPDRPTGRRVHE